MRNKKNPKVEKLIDWLVIVGLALYLFLVITRNNWAIVVGIPTYSLFLGRLFQDLIQKKIK